MPDRNRSKETEKTSNFAVSLDQMIRNTEENIKQAEVSMEFAGEEELEHLEEKNERRRHEIERMRKMNKENK